MALPIFLGLSVAWRISIPAVRGWLVKRQIHGAVSRLKCLNTILPTVDAFIFDCDGVLWYMSFSLSVIDCEFLLFSVQFYRKGMTVIEGAAAALKKLRDANKKVFFITNNSMKSRKNFLKKLTDLGLNADYTGTKYLVQIRFYDWK
jgi:hypothetical protein